MWIFLIYIHSVTACPNQRHLDKVTSAKSSRESSRRLWNLIGPKSCCTQLHISSSNWLKLCENVVHHFCIRCGGTNPLEHCVRRHPRSFGKPDCTVYSLDVFVFITCVDTSGSVSAVFLWPHISLPWSRLRVLSFTLIFQPRGATAMSAGNMLPWRQPENQWGKDVDGFTMAPFCTYSTGVS